MNFCIKVDPVTGQKYMSVRVRGRELLLDPTLNKGTAFTRREREELDLNGILPPAVLNMQLQLDRAFWNYREKASALQKYIFLAGLQDRNETLFYRLLHEHIEEMMPIIYTPVVGEACQKFSHIYRRTRGLYVSYDQRDRIDRVLVSAPCRTPSIIVVTDGERILGLGDQGAGGMAIPIGKLSLYTLCAGVSPFTTLPIMLDVGTDNEELLKDPLYLGLRQNRVRGEAYQEFVDRFVAAIKRAFPGALLQWEDFLKGNAIKQLHRFREEICSFNDDIQGTAGVVVAGIYSGLRITGQPMKDQRLVFAGAGAAGQGIADLFVAALVDEGIEESEARRRIWTVDSRGLVTRDRTQLEEFKATYARDPAEVSAYQCRDRSRITLEEVIRNVKPTILLGTTGSPGTFTEAVVRAMAECNGRPMIFPLSNPTSRSECTAEEALRWSDGRAIVATGSPFDPVEIDGRKRRIGQGNNAYIFPGVGLGLAIARPGVVTNSMFLEAARALASTCTDSDLEEGSVYPGLTRSRECSHTVACAVIRRALADGTTKLEVQDSIEDTVRRAMWFPDYLPIRHEPLG